jgi:amino acid permease
MFENLEWRTAFRRAFGLIAFYVVILYVMSQAFPETFGISRNELPMFAVNAVFIYLVFVVFTAFTERSRKRRIEEMKSRKKREEEDKRPESGEESRLKGRPNPNTSRRKTRRRR